MDCRFSSFDKERRFTDLCEAVKHCNLCQGYCEINPILTPANGNINSKVIFIAEAPGRLGAHITGKPLYGDKTGENFENLLGNIGWHRDDIFITNAVLCNPRKQNGNNDTPKWEVIQNCRYYLEMTIEIVKPEVVVTLGKVALDALAEIQPHKIEMKNHVGKTVKWADRLLVPLYHPGPRALVHRSHLKQRSDFMALAKIVNPIKGVIQQRGAQTAKSLKSGKFAVTPFKMLILTIVNTLGKISYFKLTKLLYLIDLEALERIGQTITGEIYLRQQEGPWPPELKKVLPPMDGQEIKSSFQQRMPLVEPGSSPRFDIEFEQRAFDLILAILDKYGKMSEARLKAVAYRTQPMRYLLEQEAKGRDMRRIPVIYKGETAKEIDSRDLRN